jgi:hypothetical protein
LWSTLIYQNALQPLSDIFSATLKGAPNPFANALAQPNRQHPKIEVAQDVIVLDESQSNMSPAHDQGNPSQQQRAVLAGPGSSLADSGYHGSQPEDADARTVDRGNVVPRSKTVTVTTTIPAASGTPTQASIDETFQSAKEEQTRQMTEQIVKWQAGDEEEEIAHSSALTIPPESLSLPPVGSRSGSPIRSSPRHPSPQRVQQPQHAASVETATLPEKAAGGESLVMHEPVEALRSPSESSSPIRPVVRKSSLNFASLPAREPLASKKSLGPGMSGKTSQFDARQSYYNRQAGSKSLGVAHQPNANDDRDDRDDRDELDADDADNTGLQGQVEMDTKIAAHNKTYTQRLQDQISMLGKSQANVARPSKSVHTAMSAPPQSQPTMAEPFRSWPPLTETKVAEQAENLKTVIAPGAFPDELDDWIAPPAVPAKTPARDGPRPAFSKSYSTDVMDGVHSKAVAVSAATPLPRSRPNSPMRIVGSAAKSSVLGHQSSASVPTFANFSVDGGEAMRSPVKGVSVSNPPLSTVDEDGRPNTPSKSPSRSFKDSPLKQVKNKLSSILKSSKGLLASSAAISAEGKSLCRSPASSSRMGLQHSNTSAASLSQMTGRPGDVAYPDLTQRILEDAESISRPPSSTQSGSPRKTRASIERGKRELKEKEKESKEARRVAEQMDKLEKLREKEREKARVFSKEQEKMAEMDRQVAVQKEQERVAREAAPPLPPKQMPQATRTSPRRKPVADARAHPTDGEQDVEMPDAAALMPPPSVPRPGTSASNRGQPVKRPLKPGQVVKGRPAPTVIRVNTTSSQQSQFHPSNSVLSATLQDSFGGPSHQLNSKSSKASLQTKPSLQSLKGSMSASGRPKALELAARKKEQEEREAQRKREAKAELERKRAAQQEEERRQEVQRRQEAEKQKEQEKEQLSRVAEAKKNAQRQAAIEKAKLTMAPPPPMRVQPGGPPQHSLGSSRSQEESGRPVNAVLSNASKSTQKRPMPQDSNEEPARPGLARNPPSYQKQDAKRMRMSDPAEDDLALETLPSMKGPPVRPSAGLKKVCSTMRGHARTASEY